MITYQLESFDQYYQEAKELLERHWSEVALNKGEIPLEVDVATYRQFDEAGIMHIVTVREDGKLIGYHASLVKTHLHYASSLTAFTDVYFIAPEKRTMPTVALRLFKEVERTLKQRGVQRIITTTKLHLDKSRIFEHLGFTEVERVFTKII